jgi:hypothetical protein
MVCVRPRRGKIVLDYVDSRHRRRWETFPDTPEGAIAAKIREGEVLKARRAGVSVDDRASVGELIDSWLRVAEKTVAAGTYAHYKGDAARIRARFGSDRVGSMNAPKLLDFGAELVDEGLARSTVATHLGTFHVLLEHAVTYGYLAGNPASGICRKLRIRRKETADVKAMTEDQLAVRTAGSRVSTARRKSAPSTSTRTPARGSARASA